MSQWNFQQSLSEKLIRKKLTCEQEEGENHDGGVTEVQEGRCGSLDLQLGDEVVDAVDEEVERGEPARQVTAPPPVVVLGVKKHF